MLLLIVGASDNQRYSKHDARCYPCHDFGTDFLLVAAQSEPQAKQEAINLLDPLFPVNRAVSSYALAASTFLAAGGIRGLFSVFQVQCPFVSHGCDCECRRIKLLCTITTL